MAVGLNSERALIVVRRLPGIILFQVTLISIFYYKILKKNIIMFYTFISSCFAQLEKQLFYLVINLFLSFFSSSDCLKSGSRVGNAVRVNLCPTLTKKTTKKHNFPRQPSQIFHLVPAQRHRRKTKMKKKTTQAAVNTVAVAAQSQKHKTAPVQQMHFELCLPTNLHFLLLPAQVDSGTIFFAKI